MALVYIEYISRRSGVSLEAFHQVAAQAGWAGAYAEDQLVLSVGRTWRLGVEPEYMAVWYTPEAGLERIDEWERLFSSREAAALEEPFMLAARIEQAGCYEPLLEPVPGRGGPYYAECFDFAPGASREEVRSFFTDRAAGHTNLTLILLLDRIGKLGPDPRGLAFWELPRFGALEAVARELDAVDGPVRLLRCGVYADFGSETL